MIDPKGDSNVEAAIVYWQQLTVWAAAHAAGLRLPLSDPIQRIREPRGHWGANSGIAWICAHACAQWKGKQAMLGVVGTGHATGFQFAHQLAIGAEDDWKQANSRIATYGQPGGDPTEYLSFPKNMPQVFGELGLALAVSQALSHLQDRLVLCVLGDGECETPATLAAFVHHDILSGLGPGKLLVAVNCNGYRMGGASSMGVKKLRSLLKGLGYRVFESDTDANSASETASCALQNASECQPTAWLSVTNKGWPAPEVLARIPFAGAAAHKLTEIARSSVATNAFDAFILSIQEKIVESIKREECRSVFDVASSLSFSVEAHPPVSAPTLLTRSALPIGAREARWLSPMKVIDRTLDDASVLVFSPDEAASNQMSKDRTNGLLVEVLAEEVLFGWAIGAVSTGKLTALVTYEAFAPLFGSQLAQYSKLIGAQQPSNRPPLILVCTSPSWANCPTHQNSDIWDTALNRSSDVCTLCSPIGASSAKSRLSSALERRDGHIFVMIVSKHLLPDLPDPGGAAVLFYNPRQNVPRHLVVTCGDVCSVEAISAAQITEDHGVAVDVLHIAEPGKLEPDTFRSMMTRYQTVRGSVMCHPRTLSGMLSLAFGRVIEVNGIAEPHGATPYDSLVSCAVDRYSVARSILGDEVDFARGSPNRHLIPDFELREFWHVCSV
jgi:xylulose-5-phosphate/fructose-6-phosphate phosphoketolase